MLSRKKVPNRLFAVRNAPTPSRNRAGTAKKPDTPNTASAANAPGPPNKRTNTEMEKERRNPRIKNTAGTATAPRAVKPHRKTRSGQRQSSIWSKTGTAAKPHRPSRLQNNRSDKRTDATGHFPLNNRPKDTPAQSPAKNRLRDTITQADKWPQAVQNTRKSFSHITSLPLYTNSL